jgi:uncharacterized membrane protein
MGPWKANLVRVPAVSQRGALAMEYYGELIEITGRLLDGVGVLAMVLGAAIASVRLAVHVRTGGADLYRTYRQDLGRAILLGLEFLIAGDIIRTVVVAPTLENVFVLALIVIIRTFLSMTLQLEIDGRWPWQRAAGPGLS